MIASPSLVPSLKLARHRIRPDQRSGDCAPSVAGMREASTKQLWLAAELRNAIDRNEFRMHYQPILSCRTGEVASIEALIRWEHPTGGTLPPAEFLEVLVRAELMTEVGRWTVAEVARQAAEWRRDLGNLPPIAINVSPRQLSDPAFLPFVLDTLAAWGLSPANVTFDLTEQIELGTRDDALRPLREMRAAGLRVCIDDFGTEYSSQSYLQELPVDAIKIDRACMRDIDVDQRQRSIVRAMIRLAHELDLEVVAEGVESRGQLETLWSLGCDQVQGHFFAHPVAAAPMRAWLSQLRCLAGEARRRATRSSAAAPLASLAIRHVRASADTPARR